MTALQEELVDDMRKLVAKRCGSPDGSGSNQYVMPDNGWPPLVCREEAKSI